MKASYIDLENCTSAQKRAWRRIGKIYAEMYSVWDVKYLDDLMEEGERLWNEYFPFQANNTKNWHLRRHYNNCRRELLARPSTTFTVNLFGCTININTKE